MNRRQLLVQKQFLNNEKAVIKRLHQVYNQSLADITDKVKNLEFSINNLQQKYDWMDDKDPNKEKVKSQIQSKIHQKQYQEQLKSRVDGVLKQMQTKNFLAVSDYLNECYYDGFIGTMFDQHGQGVPLLSPINQEEMVAAVQLESKISKGLYNRLGEDVDLLKKKIVAQVSRAIATGESFDQLAKQLAGVSRIGYNNAIRIARTEGGRVQTTAAKSAMLLAQEQGADILKLWDSTLDAKTRESHVAVDGEIRELDKPFSNGLDRPLDPHGKASEVINCRCALLQVARWELEDDGSFTKYNGFTRQSETFNSPQEYSEFKKAFFSEENVRYMKNVERMQAKYGTKNFGTVLDKMTPREYQQHTRLLSNNPVFRKKKPDEGVFTTLNATKADTIRPRSIMLEMQKSDLGTELLEYLNEENVPVRLCYGVDNLDGRLGKYDPIDDEITIYCDETKTIKETAVTVIHEATHRKLGCEGTFEEEVECFKAEMIHQKGHLTNDDIRGIIERVRKSYPDLSEVNSNET